MADQHGTFGAGPQLDGDVGVAAGAVVLVRDEEWLVRSAERFPGGPQVVSCTGISELVRDTEAVFLSDLDEIVPLDPRETRLVADDSPGFRRTRLLVEAALRKTPMPLHDGMLHVAHRMLLDRADYQRQAVAQALAPDNLRTRLLFADAVGLGKTLEIGMLLAELARRGRAERVLVVTPRHVLEQVQWELWTRFALPLVRLDSAGLQRVRQQLPASRNPFTFFKKVIVSVDTLKSGRYRAHLERHRWDVVVIDESHNLTNSSTLNNQLARVLAPNTDALVLASATPHNGKPESFASLISLLDPTAIADPADYDRDSIEHLFVRRHRHSPEVAREVGHLWAERLQPQVRGVPATAAEEAVVDELVSTWLHPADGGGPVAGPGRRLFPWTLAKAFLSSPAALIETIGNRQRATTSSREQVALARLLELARAADQDSAKLGAIVELLRAIGVGPRAGVRVVLFSERARTLTWLREQLPALLGMAPTAFAVLHGGLPDYEQMQVVEDFQLATSPIRVLITGDVASEGVNLHRRCHHLVHVDLPWSLIRIEQRNGRIDRYGQLHPPEITALALTTGNELFAGDVRVITKLLAKEHAAHRALGDAASLMGLHDEGAEERTITELLASGGDVEMAVPDPPTGAADGGGFDAWFALAGAQAPPAPRVEDGYLLFRSDLDFVRTSLVEAYGDPARPVAAGGVGWREHAGDLAELVPPPDLMTRLAVLPQSYLSERRVRDTLVLATTPAAAEEHLRQARDGRESGTMWPAAHFLGPQHPVVEWAVDKALASGGRGTAPVVAGAVDMTTVLMLGTWTNVRGQVVMRVLNGIGFLTPDVRSVFEEPLDLLARAGVRDSGTNPGGLTAAQVATAQELVPAAVDHMTAQLTSLREFQAEEIAEPIRLAERRLESWRADRGQRSARLTGAVRAREDRETERHRRDAAALVEALSAAGEPHVRVLAVVVPR